MSKRYIFLAIVLLGSAFGLTMLPEKTEPNAVTPEEFLIKIYDQSRFLSTDLIAKRIIERDPGLFIIDVRTPDQFEEYSIPGSVNIPLDLILKSEWSDYLNQEGMDFIFVSNGDVYAEQAWALAVQKGYTNLYVMKGGMNEWFRNIMLPVEPSETEDSQAFVTYQFRKGASQFFGGTPGVVAPAEQSVTPKKQVIVRKKKKKEAEGGC
jgi:rhodanese-related sulfurtransferase